MVLSHSGRRGREPVPALVSAAATELQFVGPRLWADYRHGLRSVEVRPPIAGVCEVGPIGLGVGREPQLGDAKREGARKTETRGDVLTSYPGGLTRRPENLNSP